MSNKIVKKVCIMEFGIKFQLAIAICIFANVVQSSKIKTPKLSRHPVLLVVSFDGFRFDYLEKVDMPAFETIRSEGVSVPFMKAQFPTKTFVNHQSIATGLFPDFHGITDNTLYDPAYHKILSGSDPAFWVYHPDVIPFWIRNEQAGEGRYSGCYFWAGSSHGYGQDGNLFPTYYIPKYNGSIPWETRVETVVTWILDDEKPANMIYLYHNEPDSQGHKSGTDDPKTIEAIIKVNERLAHLVQRLKDVGIYDLINLIVLSDHGMQTVHKDQIINTTIMTDPNLYDRYGGSPVFHIQPKNSSDISKVYDSFKSASVGKNFSVYKKADLEFLNYGRNRRVMDIVLLADPGYGFDDLRLNENLVCGVHGYIPTNSNMTTIFMARGPQFKTGLKHPNPIENVDLFSLFSKIMGVPVSPNNGSFERVSMFLSASISIQSSFGFILFPSVLLSIGFIG